MLKWSARRITIAEMFLELRALVRVVGVEVAILLFVSTEVE